MIVVGEEQLIPLREVPRHLPPRPSGKRVHISACYRWISRGVRGARLEALRIGGTTYTSLEALQRFSRHLENGPAPQVEAPVSSRARQRAIERASQAARAELGLDHHPSAKDAP
jgi:hypothetical protein